MRRRIGVALGVAGVAGAVVVVAIVATRHGSGADAPASGRSIDMARATVVNCPAPIAPGPGHPSVVLSHLFRVEDTSGTPYLLGWTIVPYRAERARYELGATGNVLALEPAAGGAPVGYGKGRLTFSSGTGAGSVDASITPRGGGAIRVRGDWRCAAAGG